MSSSIMAHSLACRGAGGRDRSFHREGRSTPGTARPTVYHIRPASVHRPSPEFCRHPPTIGGITASYAGTNPGFSDKNSRVRTWTESPPTIPGSPEIGRECLGCGLPAAPLESACGFSCRRVGDTAEKENAAVAVALDQEQERMVRTKDRGRRRATMIL
jgi:hypothetical protein